MMTSLREVREVLESSESEHAQPFLRLLTIGGKNGPSKVKPRSKTQERFGFNPLSFPQLGKKISLFPSPPPIEELQQILLRDLATQDAGVLVFFPPRGSPTEDALNATNTIDNIANSGYESDGMIPNLVCPSLEDLRQECKEAHTHVLGETQTTVSVIPHNTLLKLQHFNESFTYSTVLTGTMVSIIWPPTKHNLDILQQAYAQLAKTNSSGSLDVTDELEGGVAFVQKPGEAVRCPPFGLVIAFTMETTVIAKASIVTVDSFLMALQNISILEAWWKTEEDEAQKRASFALSVSDIITEILDGNFDDLETHELKYPFEQESALKSLINAWAVIKDNVCELLKDQAAEDLKLKWRAILHGCRGDTCMLCGQKLKRAKGDGVKEHFERYHWATGVTTGKNKYIQY